MPSFWLTPCRLQIGPDVPPQHPDEHDERGAGRRTERRAGEVGRRNQPESHPERQPG